jgi:hypothetical protein
MSLILASCTSKKRPKSHPELRASALPAGDLAGVLLNWSGRVRAAEHRVPARDLYIGNGWRHARTAAQAAGVDLAVISAGLGVVRAETPIPSYDLTIVNAHDDIRRRVDPPISATDWWRAISAERLTGPTLLSLLDGEPGLVLAALPLTYLSMVADELAASRPAREGRLRVFTGAQVAVMNPEVINAVMPYDSRLDDPGLGLGGTADSFAARALRHFVETFGVEPACDLAADKTRVLAELAARVAPTRARRARRSDAEIALLLKERWRDGHGKTSRLLRILRDDLGVACEQSRIARLMGDLRAAGGVDVV